MDLYENYSNYRPVIKIAPLMGGGGGNKFYIALCSENCKYLPVLNYGL